MIILQCVMNDKLCLVFDHLGTLMVDHDGSGTLRHQKAAAKFSSDGHHLWHMVSIQEYTNFPKNILIWI